MFGSNIVKAGVSLHLLDKMTPEMRKTLAANKGMLNTFGQAIGQQGLFGPMAQKNLDQYNRGLAQMAASQKLLMTGAVGFGAGIAAAAYTTSSFVKFEDDLAYIDTLRDESTSAMDIWGKDIRRIGGETGKDIADISRSIYQSLSSSIPEDEVLDFIRVASKSSVAGRTSMENSVNALATVLNSYDLAVDKSMEVSDKLFYTVKRGRIEFDQLSNTIAGFAQSGSLAGIGYEDLLASLATLTSVGISADEASTSINRFLLSVISLSDEQKELGRSMGIDFNIAHMRKVGFLPFLQEISDAVDGDIEKLQKLFPEMRAFRAVAPLIGSANERFKDISEGMKNTAGATETAFSKMADTMQFDINRMKQNFESLKIGVGGIFAKQLNPQLEGLVDTLDNLAEDDAAISRIAGAIKTITYSFGGLAGIGILGKIVGTGNLLASGFKSALAGGSLVADKGGLAFLGSAAGKLGALGGAGTGAGFIGGGGLASAALAIAPLILTTLGSYGMLKLDKAVEGSVVGKAAEKRITDIQNLLAANNDLNRELIKLQSPKTEGEANRKKELEEKLSKTQVELNASKEEIYGKILEYMAIQEQQKNQNLLFQVGGAKFVNNKFGLQQGDSLFGGGGIDYRGKVYSEREAGLKELILQYGNLMREQYSYGIKYADELYYGIALDKMGGDSDLAKAMVGIVTSGMFPSLYEDFQKALESQKNLPAEKSAINQMLSPRSKFWDIIENRSSTFGEDSPFYNRKLRYAYDPIIARQMGNTSEIKTFAEMIENKVEKDDWSIIVNINENNQATATLSKNGKEVKSIESYLNRVKTRQMAQRNPNFFDKPF